MIPVSVALILKSLASTKGKSGTQIDIEREVKALLEKRGVATMTEAELEALFEEASLECAMRDVTAKMRKEGKLPTFTKDEAVRDLKLRALGLHIH